MGKSKGKAEIIIIAIITIIIIGVVIYFNIANKKEPIIYGVAEASGTVSNTFIEDSKSLKKFISKSSLNDEITIDYKKYSVKEAFAYYIVGFIYNEERTDATVKYIYKTDGYKGKFSRSWVTCMIVEVDNTVTNVNFVLDNSSIEEDKK